MRPGSIDELGLGEKNDEAAVAIVVTHDCDLAQTPEVEANVEVIVGHRIARMDGNYAYAKNARQLHLALTGGSEEAVAEFRATEKRSVPKLALATQQPSKTIRAAPPERMILQRWLAARYRRAAFPDEFDRRLSDLGIRSAITKVLKANGNFLSAIYFDVDQGREIIRTESNDPYELSIYLLYTTQHDALASEQAGLRAAASLEAALRRACYSHKDNKWTGIELVECEAVSEEAMTVQQADQLYRWSADYLSLRTDPAEPMRRDD